MSDKTTADSDDGDLQYFPKTIKCQCCKKTKKRHNFTSQYEDELGEIRWRLNLVCSECREVPVSPTKHVKWNGRGGRIDAVSRPSIIDLMESYRDG